MVRTTVTVERELEARDLAMIVQTAGRYKSNIRIRSGNYEVNAKSIMGVMTLSQEAGSGVELIADGSDEKEALEGLCKFLGGK